MPSLNVTLCTSPVCLAFPVINHARGDEDPLTCLGGTVLWTHHAITDRTIYMLVENSVPPTINGQGQTNVIFNCKRVDNTIANACVSSAQKRHKNQNGGYSLTFNETQQQVSTRLCSSGSKTYSTPWSTPKRWPMTELIAFPVSQNDGGTSTKEMVNVGWMKTSFHFHGIWTFFKRKFNNFQDQIKMPKRKKIRLWLWLLYHLLWFLNCITQKWLTE